MLGRAAEGGEGKMEARCGLWRADRCSRNAETLYRLRKSNISVSQSSRLSRRCTASGDRERHAAGWHSYFVPGGHSQEKGKTELAARKMQGFAALQPAKPTHLVC